jgi:hypothetical protein
MVGRSGVNARAFLRFLMIWMSFPAVGGSGGICVPALEDWYIEGKVQ